MDKKFLFAMFMSFLTVWIVQQYLHKHDNSHEKIPENIVPGQSYKVPTQKELSQPLNREIDFVDKKIIKKESIIEIETNLYTASFTNYGASLSSLEFKKYNGKYNKPLQTLRKINFYDREQSVFLLALQEKTPYFYEFVGKEEFDDRFVLSFVTNIDGWEIRKNFSLYKKNHKLDLELIFNKKGKHGLDFLIPRLFFAAPILAEVDKNEQVGFCSNMSGKIENVPENKMFEQAWIAPRIFGGQDKYFAHCLINDVQSFTQRAYFKKFSNNLLHQILEGQRIEGSKSFTLSFYMGPKSTEELDDVDPRLEELLSFGWLSWFCRVLLKLLIWIFEFTGNYGFAIIILTILIKVPFVPLSVYARKSMDRYSKFQPQVNAIKRKYKNNLTLQNAELMKFHKEHNLSMATPMVGCLPLLLQLPILFSLYRVVGGYLDLYQAPFFGWITDLSSKDPYYILPIVMGISGVLQQVMSPSGDEKTRTMMWFMPIFMIVIFMNFPAGIVIYWLTNNLFTIGEDLIRKRFFK